MAWQPIETAPRDRWILLKGGETNEHFYMGDEPPETNKRAVVAIANPELEDEFFDPEWVYDYWDGAWRSGYNNPTHWMDIPE